MYRLVELIKGVLACLDDLGGGALGGGSGGSDLDGDSAVVASVSRSGGLQDGVHLRRRRNLSVLGVLVLVEQGQLVMMVVVVTMGSTRTGRDGRGGGRTATRGGRRRSRSRRG